MAKQWSKAWKSSKNPSKQRKYRDNAEYHHRDRFVSARLKDKLQDMIGTKTMPVREGDRVRIVRGDYYGTYGDIRRVDRENYKLYIDGVNRETVSGSEVTVPIDPSNVIITEMNLDDDKRVEKYGLTDEEKREIRVEKVEEEPEEDVDEETDETEDVEDAATDDEDAEETASADVDYEELVKENIADIKDTVREQELDPEKVLEAEQDNKDRKTLVEWLESRAEGDSR